MFISREQLAEAYSRLGFLAVETPTPAQMVFRHEQDGRVMFYATTVKEGVDFELAFTDALRLYGHEFAEQLREAIRWVLR